MHVHISRLYLRSFTGCSDSSTLTLGRSTADDDTLQRSQSAFARRPVIVWPPLSMTAIEEYKPERAAPGQGDYKQGKVWGTGIVRTTSVQQQQVAAVN